MKSHTSTSFFLLLLSIIISIVASTKYEDNNVSSNVDVTKEKEQHYLIYVNNTAGEFKVFGSEGRIKKRQEIQAEQFIFSMVDDIHDVIIENKDTYENQEKFEELEEKTKLRKRDFEDINNGDNGFIKVISSIDNISVLYGYFSEAVAEKVSKFENVIGCEPDSKSSKYKANNTNKYYNVNDIRKETKWKNITTRRNADFHLSLISQGKYNKKLVNKYDNNYYFPTSAGQDTDIIIIDSGFKFNFAEFTNVNRTAKCVGYLNDGKFVKSKSCTPILYNHGQQVSDVAAGAKHGVASKANVYGIGLSVKYYSVEDGDVIAAFQYVYEKMIRPHKTVINTSFVGYSNTKDNYYIQLNKLATAITKKGGIIVSCADSWDDEIDSSKSIYRVVPCSISNIICVGGYENSQKKDFTKVYKKSDHSSYGKDVDIYAPIYVNTQYLNDKNKVVTEKTEGTSFSSAIVTGVISTILGNNPTTKFTKDTMLNHLTKNAPTITFKNKKLYLINNGKHIVYSEDGIYHGCGVNAGNTPCKK